MDSQNRIDLSSYRLKKAEDNLSASKLLYDNNDFSGSINRSYYAIFHAVRAVTALDGFDSKKHSSIIGFFNKTYVKSNAVSRECSKIIRNAFETRNRADYDDFYIVDKSEALEQIENANIFITEISSYIQSRRIRLITDEAYADLEEPAPTIPPVSRGRGR